VAGRISGPWQIPGERIRGRFWQALDRFGGSGESEEPAGPHPPEGFLEQAQTGRAIFE